MRKTVPRAQLVTTAPENLQQEQSGRIRRYLTAMGIRTVCFLAAVPLHGWARWTAVVMAVVLPYFAVVMANAVRPRAAGAVQEVTWRSPETLEISAEVVEGDVIGPEPPAG